MRAWVLTGHGRPEHVLALRERPDLVPGPGQVLIRSEGFGLNYADVMAVKGLYRDAPPPPCVLGYEAVGRVERCGEGVPATWMGKRVVAMTRFGGYAEQVVTDHRAMAEIAARFDAHLIVDEAHATGLYGARLRGVHELEGVVPLATVHPCGKALGHPPATFGEFRDWTFSLSDDEIIAINKNVRPFAPIAQRRRLFDNAEKTGIAGGDPIQ